MQHFLSIADYSRDELWNFLQKAKSLKDELKTGGISLFYRGRF